MSRASQLPSPPPYSTPHTSVPASFTVSGADTGKNASTQRCITTPLTSSQKALMAASTSPSFFQPFVLASPGNSGQLPEILTGLAAYIDMPHRSPLVPRRTSQWRASMPALFDIVTGSLVRAVRQDTCGGSLPSSTYQYGWCVARAKSIATCAFALTKPMPI
ncbi:hypothetical protein BU25DRAFT_424191 [Macroventuria anomochaeta]|uniref:Uncharacterized protein n=1 Tax=Macroventuria anomochaeta TaxID=301207 RepID=A0ACB6RR32_9PLEO|nr:uncharacterized protein BU25DRAFT_424191 [Macroventuria anomochaeta]KAF2624420.1 hypothetical protein BU25DRAFT_424191 [Macroventuria anomochaeta]